jgi:hypothetical protein
VQGTDVNKVVAAISAARPRHFPPPWSVEEQHENEPYDSNGAILITVGVSGRLG